MPLIEQFANMASQNLDSILITLGEESGDYTEWEQVPKHFLIPWTLMEPYSPWMNQAKGKIRCMKTHYQWITNHHQCPETLWCFGMEYTLALREQIAFPGLENWSPLEWLTGKTPYISEFMDFDFYQFVIWYNPNDPNEGGQT